MNRDRIYDELDVNIRYTVYYGVLERIGIRDALGRREIVLIKKGGDLPPERMNDCVPGYFVFSKARIALHSDRV